MDRCPWVQTNERSKEDAMLHLITLLRDRCGRAFPSVTPSVEPEVMEPEGMEPETMEPETMEPETMEPEAMEPEAMESEAMEPEAWEAWGSVVEQACSFLEQHYAEHISLDQLCRRTGVSKSTLLRAFSKGKGISPYGYLETVRIGAAKKLLEQGLPPVEVALRTGFSDQSHLTNSFSRFLGVAPGAYRDIFLKDLKA
ncbi:MAG TPA: helix-turn-helix domain-containing protein [Candidatus Ventrimonas merdavium]|nr:helix-turn-helix domain-containing protein [Candidatus Ventrimonas merdavium]